MFRVDVHRILVILKYFLPAQIAQIPISLNFLNRSISRPARFEPMKPPKNILIMSIPILKFTSPSIAPPSVLRAIIKKPKSVLNDIF